MSVAPGSSGSAGSSSVGGWIRNSVARSSFGRRSVTSGGWGSTAAEWLGVGAELEKVDPSAAYHTFSKHWQQTCDIMERTRLSKKVIQDDVTAVINHLGQMVTLLQVDIRQIMTKDRPACYDGNQEKSDRTSLTSNCPNSSSSTYGTKPYTNTSSLPPLDPPTTPIFDHFLGEEILDKVLDWSLGTGEFTNSLKLEQLKMHEILLSQSRQELLVYKPVIRPLIKLLDSCLSCIPVEVERHLVLLLNQLCASLLHNQQLLNFFFLSSPNEQGDAKFLIFSLLLPFVHREGDLGQQARDALLLCMALSNTHPPVGQYIADTSNFCPLLAAGMCGLYSTLPRVLPSSVTLLEGWHHISAKDIPNIPNLQVFLNALEFCNAVVQVGHPLVRNELVELVYQGFLVLVLGPALHQDGAVSDVQQDFSAPPVNMEEVVTATAYVDLFLSYATEPQLRRAFLAFLLTSPPTEDNTPQPAVITTLISRLHSDNTRVCLVTLQLFTRIIDCWCEDAMFVLVFQYLLTGSHVMLSHRTAAMQQTPLSDMHRLIDLMPTVLKHEEECSMCSYATCEESSVGTTTPYYQTLQRARTRIHRTTDACSNWVWRYDGNSPAPDEGIRLLEEAKSVLPQPYPKIRSISDPTNKTSETAPNALLVGVAETDRRNSLPGKVSRRLGIGSRRGCGTPGLLNLSHDDDQQPDSLGESSGYESFNIRNSRDSSPSSSPPLPSSPSQASRRHQRRSGGRGARGTLPRRLQTTSPHGSPTPLDEDFLEELMNWDLKEEGEPLRKDDGEAVADSFQLIEEAFSLYSPASPQHTSCQDSSCDEVNWDEPGWSCPPSPPSSPSLPHARPTIGPFLEALLERVEGILSTSVPVTQLLFSLLLRLASCPSPVLTSLLLHPSILWQPAVRSLYQVLSTVKQRIDSCLSEDDAHLLSAARSWFAGRGGKAAAEPVKMIAQHHQQTSLHNTPTEHSGRGRRSLTAAVTGAVGALFKRTSSVSSPSAAAAEGTPMQFLPSGSSSSLNSPSIRYYHQQSPSSSPDSTPPPSLTSSLPYSASTTPSSSSCSLPTITLPTPAPQSPPYPSVLRPPPPQSGPGGVLTALPSSPSLHSSTSFSATPGAAPSSSVVNRQAVHSYNPAKVHAARCALMMRELLLELTALAQEQAVYCDAMLFDWHFPPPQQDATAASSSTETQHSSTPSSAAGWS